jgi:hypothetical protein
MRKDDRASRGALIGALRDFGGRDIKRVCIHWPRYTGAVSRLSRHWCFARPQSATRSRSGSSAIFPDSGPPCGGGRIMPLGITLCVTARSAPRRFGVHVQQTLNASS